MMIKQSFQGKLMTVILLMAIVSILLVIIYNVNYNRKKEQINDILARINKLKNDLILDIKSQSDFIRFNAIDTNYFISYRSHNLDTYRRLTEEVKVGFNSLTHEKNLLKQSVNKGTNQTSGIIN